MEFKGEFIVKADRHTVSSFISDIDKIVSIIPDVKSSEKIDENSSRLIVKAGQSAIKGKFNLLLEIKNRIDDESVEVTAKGSGTTGSLDLKGSYRFVESGPDMTIVIWVVNLTIGGMIATMGSRIIKGTAEKYVSVLTDSFKSAFER